MGLLLLGMFGIAQSATAATTILTIDAFATAGQELNLSGTTGSVSESATGAAAGLMGGERQFTFEVTDNPLASSASAGIAAGSPGLAFFDLAALVEAYVTMRYAGPADVGLSGVDLEAGLASAFVFGAFNIDAPIELKVTVEDTDGDIAVGSVTHPGGIFTPTDIVLPYAAFSNTADTDFSSVDSLEFYVNPLAAGSDVALDYFATGVPIPVPEPSAGLAICLGFTALSLRRRRGS